MVERGLPLPIRKDLAKFLNRIDNANISKEDKHRLLLVWAKARDDIKKVENKR